MFTMILSAYGGVLDYDGRFTRRDLARFLAFVIAVAVGFYVAISWGYTLPNDLGFTLPAIGFALPGGTHVALLGQHVWLTTDGGGHPVGSYGVAMMFSLVAAPWLIFSALAVHAGLGRRMVDTGHSALWASLPLAPFFGALVILTIASNALAFMTVRLDVVATLVSLLPTIGLLTLVSFVPTAFIALLPSRTD